MRMTSLSLMMEVNILFHIFLSVWLFTTTVNGEPNLFNFMESLIEMNRRILQENKNDKNATANLTSVLPTVSPKPSLKVSSSTIISSQKKVEPSKLPQGENSPLVSSVVPTKKPTTQSTFYSSTERNHDRQMPLAKREKSEEDNETRFKILIYSSTVVGVVFISFIVLVVILLHKKRQKQLNKIRFSSTDQKTYKDTKIFVMSSNGKSANIIGSLNSIPSNATLWKELQSNTPNVF